MPLQKLQFRPGVNREGTTLSNEGGYFDGDKIRFRSGYPEKIGGWQADSGAYFTTVPTATFSSSGTSTAATPTSASFWGIVKGLWNWINLTGYNLLGVGTDLKYYIQNSSGGAYNDVTPMRVTTSAGAVTFAATSGSTTLVVTNASHGAQVADFVCFTGAVTLGGAITALVLNREYQVQTVTSNNTYTITSSASAGGFVIGVTYVIASIGTTDFTAIGAASNTVGVVFVATGVGSGTGTASPRANGSDTNNGGGSVIGNYQLTTGYSTFTLGVGWGAGGWGGSVGPSATTALTASINSSSTAAIAVTSTSGFIASGLIYIGSEGISYPSTTGTTFASPVIRGFNTTAAAHTNGDAVFQYPATSTGWGSPATTGIGIQLRLWSQSNYGEDLVLNPRGAAMYYWANNGSPNIYDRAQIVKVATNIVTKSGTFTPDSTCPSVANFVLVSDASRFTFAFGTNDPTGVYATIAQDPMQIRWSDQNSVATWLPAITNQAGGIRLSHGSQIITAIQTRQEILVLTDSAIYSFQYLGAPYVWGSQLLADNISIISPNAMVVVNNVTYWMGTDKFYMYSGRVETLPCALRQYIYNNINLTEAFQFFSGTNEGYNEIWWFYCSITGTTSAGENSTGTPGSPNRFVDRYVIYNHLERTWYYGTWNGTTVRPRTAWLDSPLRAEPIAGIGYNSGGLYTNGAVVYHETTVDNNETNTPVAIDAYVQSSDFDIGDGHNFGFVWRLIPDITFDGSSSAAPSVNFTVRPRAFPGSNYGNSNSPDVDSTQSYVSTTTYNVQQFTQQVYVRIRGRQMAFKISSSDLGTQWQLGVPRIDVRPDGRR